MSEKAIKDLRLKFIAVSMGSLIITMMLIAGLLYTGNLLLNRHTVRTTLNYIADHDGELVKWNKEEENDSDYIRILDDIFSVNGEYQSSEFRFATRYFAILFDKEGNVTEIKANHIAAVSEEEAETYGKQALEKSFKFGRVNNYYYRVKVKDDQSKIVVYMDASNVFRSNDRLLNMALILIALGMLVAFGLVRVISSKVIAREMKMADLQKQFMTNVSHELKTPLAVIRANTEMQEMLEGETEWTESNMRQVERMSGLIQNLVMITKAEEKRGHEDVINVDMTKAVQETTDNLKSLAVQSGKTLVTNIEDNVRIRAEEAQMRQLCSLLLDNAIKYCDENGQVTVELNKQRGKAVTLTVSNDYAEGKNVDYTRFFERFYREDSSHNTDKGGYGIGLSIAESLVKQYRGTINVSWKKGIISFTCQLKSV